MLGLEFLEEVLGWAVSPLSYIFHTLLNAFASVGARGYIQQALIGSRILKHRSAPVVYGEHDPTLALLDVLHKNRRTAGGGFLREQELLRPQLLNRIPQLRRLLKLKSLGGLAHIAF